MKKGEIKIIGNITVGKPDVDPEAPSHVRGVFQGNRHYKGQRPKGIDEETGLSDARRSTGIRPKDHDVIDPRMPKISPA